MAELVEAGLASWQERVDGHLELHVIGGGRWLLMADRFGSYTLDLSGIPAPLPFELPARPQPSRRVAAVPV